MNRVLYFLVFAAGLVVACWVGAGYVGLNPLALAMTAVIALVYVAGALELYRYQQATGTLRRALAGLSQAPASLAEWVAGLDDSLRDAVRLRVEGERVGLPGPSLTPYLVGLLVLLGMLGTFLGMVATLRGTGLALENATDLQAIRASLAAPVKGLGFAFGTSVAGVATSAMLGLLSALCRRDRARAVQELDAHAATTLRVYSQAHQREESFRLMQQQAQTLPVVADRLQALMTAMERQSQSLGEKLAAGQEAFHARSEARQATLVQQNQQLTERLISGQESFYAHTELAYSKLIHSAEKVHQNLATTTESAYSGLAASVRESLKGSLAESAQAAGAAIQPIVESTFAQLARENAALQESIRQSVQQQLEALSSRFEQTASQNEQAMAKVASLWSQALAEHKQVSESLVNEQLRISESLINEHRAAGESLVQAQQGAGEALINAQRSESESFIKAQREANESLIHAQQQMGESFIKEQQGAREALIGELRSSLEAFTQNFEQRSASMVEAVSARLGEVTAGITEGWNEALSRQQSAGEKMAQDNQQALASAVAALEQHASSLLRTMGESNTELKAALASQDSERLAAWSDAFGALTDTLREAWQKTSDATAMRQKEICDTLARTADDIAQQAREHSAGTIAEIERLVQAASEAPKVAAEVVAEVRDKLSDSMARDNAMLEERGRMLETLSTLLEAVNHASNEQRTAVDALLSSSSDLLDRIGTQVADKVEAEAGKLGQAAAQVGDSAIEIAGLGEVFGQAVQRFSESNTSLAEHLQRVEETLEKSIARSDEQLAYYVAQAREVIDLSMLSQRQIIEELQQLAGSRPGNAEAAT